MSFPHPDTEALSAHLDGYEPDLSEHVSSCPECQSALAGLRRAALAVGEAVEPLAADLRERAIAAALDALDDEAGAGPDASTAGQGRRSREVPEGREPAPVVPLPPPLPARRLGGGRWLAAGSGLAAALVLVLGAVALLVPRSGSDDASVATSAAPAFGAAGGDVTDLGDLGSFATADELDVAIVDRLGDGAAPGAPTAELFRQAEDTGAEPNEATAERSTALSEGASGAGSSADQQDSGPPPTATGSATATGASSSATATGGGAELAGCETRARDDHGAALGPLSLTAVAVYQGEAVLILGFDPVAEDGGGLTVLVLSPASCDAVAELAIP